MDVQNALNKTGFFLKRHSPAILTGAASVGLVLTAVLSGEAALKYDKLEEKTVKETAKTYIPTIAVGTVTLGCMWAAHIIGEKQLGAMTSAYILLGKQFHDYRQAVRDELGGEKDHEIIQNLAEKEHPSDDTEEPEVLIYDRLRKHDSDNGFFSVKMSDFYKAQNWINRTFILRGVVTLNEFYQELGLSKIDGGDDIGWDQYVEEVDYGCFYIDIWLSKKTTDDGVEYFEMEFPFPPTDEYYD